MPEVILPCPYCGQKSHLDDGHNVNCTVYWAECNKCEMCGPFVGTPDSAIAAWNSLPRALTWTHESPKVAGWYWVRQLGESFDIMQHYNQADIDGGFDNERQLKQWAGPIAPPID